MTVTATLARALVLLCFCVFVCSAGETDGDIYDSKVTAEGSRSCPPVVRHGAKVGLRFLEHGRKWVAGWPTNALTTAPCPGLFFSGSRKWRCSGEVFRIYGRRSGVIRVGDKVGFYYVRGRKWLGCDRHRCYIHPCPGRPSWRYGFQNRRKWRQCRGEVYRIAVRGKRIGQPVQERDPVMLMLASRYGRYLSAIRGYMNKMSCPGRFPPPTYKYDSCNGEVFEIKLL